MFLRSLGLILTFCAATVCGPATAADIVVGQCLPLTGILATSGEQIRLGTKVYFDHINDSGGIRGSRLRHLVVDDGYKIEETVRLTRELIELQKATVLVGFVGSANIAELLRQGVLARHNIALVGPLAGSELLRKPFNRNVFHIRASYADEGEHMVNHLVTVGVPKIGVFYQDDAFGEGGLAGVEAALARRNLKLVASAKYERLTDDVAPAVKSMAAADLGAIIMVSINKPSAAFAKQYRAAGGSAQLLNISVVDSGELTRLAGIQATHGLGISQVVPYPFSPNLPVVREYHSLLKRYGPPGAQPSYFGLEGFIGAKLVVEGLRHAGPNPRPEAVLQALESLERYDTGGFHLKYSKASRIGSNYIDITVIGKDGKLLH